MTLELTELQRRQFLIAAIAATGGAMAGPSILFGDNKKSSYVSLGDAHKGTLEVDLRIMNQFGDQPKKVLAFYTACRAALTGNDPEQSIAQLCKSDGRDKLGGPMLGNITPTSVSVWMHLPEPGAVTVQVAAGGGGQAKVYRSDGRDRVCVVVCDGLEPDHSYRYTVCGSKGELIGEGRFVAPPKELSEKPFRIAFGADFHKIGMYRPELMEQIRERGSRAMLLIGDSATDGRKGDAGLINADYMLRNLSPVVQQLVANVPTSATWDDWDYWNNDTSGPRTNGGKPIDTQAQRRMWKMQWNNPERETPREGIYFQTKIGPVHYIALDTRSCRLSDQRGKKGSFLGEAQTAWLKQQLDDSASPFILISGGTMWSDYISAGKDSWGTWDQEAREEIFGWIDAKQAGGKKVILLSGDRHGARGFAIPRHDAKPIHEFEVGTLGGCPGPDAFGDDREYQLFGQPSRTWAFGELTFDLDKGRPRAVFRLINEQSDVLETITI